MKKSIRFSMCSFKWLVNEYRIFSVLTTLFFLSGCAGWNVRPTPEQWAEHDKQMKNQEDEVSARLKKIYKYWPELENATASEIIYIEYFDEKGRKIGSAEAK